MISYGKYSKNNFVKLIYLIFHNFFWPVKLKNSCFLHFLENQFDEIFFDLFRFAIELPTSGQFWNSTIRPWIPNTFWTVYKSQWAVWKRHFISTLCQGMYFNFTIFFFFCEKCIFDFTNFFFFWKMNFDFTIFFSAAKKHLT